MNADSHTSAEGISSADFADFRRFQEPSICEIFVIGGQTLLPPLRLRGLARDATIHNQFDISPFPVHNGTKCECNVARIPILRRPREVYA